MQANISWELRYPPQGQPPPRNKALIRPYQGKPMVNSPLIRPAISWGGWHWGGPKFPWYYITCLVVMVITQKKIHTFTLPETNIVPENWWLEDTISFWDGVFAGDMLVLGRVSDRKTWRTQKFRKLTWLAGKWTLKWRCISYWKWGYSSQLLPEGSSLVLHAFFSGEASEKQLQLDAMYYSAAIGHLDFDLKAVVFWVSGK